MGPSRFPGSEFSVICEFRTVVAGPTVTGPTVKGPTVTGPAVVGPTVAGPTVAGPSVTGPIMPRAQGASFEAEIPNVSTASQGPPAPQGRVHHGAYSEVNQGAASPT